MPYNANLDECLYVKSWTSDAGRINVSVYSYNKGPKKLQITREIQDSQGQMKFTKLGRLGKEEVEGIMPLIQEAMAKMD